MKRVWLSLIAVVFVIAASTGHSPRPGIAGGKFEVTCTYVRSRQVDPIVARARTSAHLHDFFGAKHVTRNSTARRMVGGATSCLLRKDAAAYWVPAAYRRDTGAQLIPVKAFMYYFGTPGVTERPFPKGLSMVAGNVHASSPAEASSIKFSCGNGGDGGNKSPTRAAPYNCATDPGVRNSQGVVAIIYFPFCWDGSGLAPSDVTYGDRNGVCAPGDIRLPQLQIHEHWGRQAGDPERFDRGDLLTFSSGPWYTLHGDFMNGWKQAKLNRLVDGCQNAPNRDCGFLRNSHPGPGGK